MGCLGGVKPALSGILCFRFINKNTGKTETPEVAMRAKRTAQISLFDPQALDHPVADELEWASAWLDAHPELLDLIAADLDGGAGIEPGPSRPDRRDGAALRGAYASARRELPGTGVRAGGLALGATLRAAGPGAAAAGEIGVAGRRRGGRRGELGSDQPNLAGDGVRLRGRDGGSGAHRFRR